MVAHELTATQAPACPACPGVEDRAASHIDDCGDPLVAYNTHSMKPGDQPLAPSNPGAAAHLEAPRVRTFAVHVDARVCDGCGVCIFFCKPAVFELCQQLSPRGVFPARAARTEACNGCRLCELGCPQLAILIAPVPAEEPA
jgi:2-oxoglutarate ferredoxin oxidoreductase subunit delta